MRLEIISAADFLVQLLRLQSGSLNELQLQSFKNSLTDVLRRRYRDHWFPDRPNRGSGYRCIRINGKMDPVIAQAGAKVGLLATTLHGLFPSELTMWIDPQEVSYRIGENGSICVLFEGSKQQLQQQHSNQQQQQHHHHNHQQQQPQQQQQYHHHHHHQQHHHHHQQQQQHQQYQHQANLMQQHQLQQQQQQQQTFESCKDSLLLEHTQFSEQIAAYVSS